MTRKKQRQSVLTTLQTEPDYCCSDNVNRNSTALELSVNHNLNRHSYKSIDNNPHFPKEFSTVNDSFEKLRSNKISDYGGSRDITNRLSILNSDNSLDYTVNKLTDKDFSSYYKKKTGKIKNNKPTCCFYLVNSGNFIS